MKILHICSDYFHTAIYNNLFRSLAKNNVDNIIYVPKFEENFTTEFNLISASREYSVLERMLFYNKVKIGFKDICERININEISVVHSHNLFSSGFIAYKLFKAFGIPYIVAIRNTDLNVFFKYMIHLRKLGVEIMQSAQKVVFISPSYKDYVIEHYVPSDLRNVINNKSEVIPNGIDAFFLTNLNIRAPFIWDKKNIKIISICQLTENKNIETSIKACEILKSKYNVQLTIVGEVIDKKYLMLEKKYDFIKYHKKCNKETVLEFLRQSDIFVMPSFKETFGLVYAEALSQGMPVVYTKGQGIDGLFKEGEVGYSVNPTNDKEIADAIINIYNNYNKISTNCIKRVSKFDWQIISEFYLNIYLKKKS